MTMGDLVSGINPFDDEGGTGRYRPKQVNAATLEALRNWAGEPPVDGKHWIMVDLDNGRLKWYQSKRRRAYYRRRRW